MVDNLFLLSDTSSTADTLSSSLFPLQHTPSPFSSTFSAAATLQALCFSARQLFLLFFLGALSVAHAAGREPSRRRGPGLLFWTLGVGIVVAIILSLRRKRGKESLVDIEIKAAILVSGLQGLGAEIAKNLILSGATSVTLHDEGNVEFRDLSSNFFFTEEDVGKNRALASVKKLQNLSNSATIFSLTSSLSKEHLSKFQVVVFTDVNLELATEYDEFCHNHNPPIYFIRSEVRGLFGNMFCDFGPEFTVFDVEREEPRTQVKEPKVLKFKLLKDALRDPGDFLLGDFTKFDYSALLHLAFQALDKFRHVVGRFPIAGSGEDAEQFIAFAINMNENLGESKLQEIDKKCLQHFAYGSHAILNPMAAMVGGIVGQQIVKACAGKVQQLCQCFYYNSLESLPVEPLEPSDLKPLNCRYDAQISVFGSKFQKRLEAAKLFVVGSGDWGCEFLKNLALMGVCCSPKGKLTITDNDVIEKSHLSHRFLAAATTINPSLNIEAFQSGVSSETASVFDNAFWENLDVVINASDDVNARKYIDSKSIYFQKPPLDFGTIGANCHSIENYGATRNPTSSAIITGIVCLQIYKILGEHRPEETSIGTSSGIVTGTSTETSIGTSSGIVTGTSTETSIGTSTGAYDLSASGYRKTIVGNLSVNDLLERYNELQCEVQDISSEYNTLLYSSTIPQHVDRKDRKLIDLVRELCVHRVPLGRNAVTVHVNFIRADATEGKARISVFTQN